MAPNSREHLRMAGKASGRARSGRDPDAPGGDPSAPMPTGGDSAVDDMIAGYVAIVGNPSGWQEVKALEQTRAEIYKTKAAAREHAVATGSLFTRDQITARDEKLATIFRDQLRSVTDLMVQIAAPEKIRQAQAQAQEWTDRVASAVADAIEAMGT
jgi:hypothetical protein